MHLYATEPNLMGQPRKTIPFRSLICRAPGQRSIAREVSSACARHLRVLWRSKHAINRAKLKRICESV